MSNLGKQPKLHFALIDCKECDLIFTFDGCGFNQNAGSEHNIRLLHLAKREYLDSLRVLQEKIRAKFEPQLKPESKEDVMDLLGSCKLTKELYETAKINYKHLCYS